nr:ciliary opsin [Echiniscus sp.]
MIVAAWHRHWTLGATWCSTYAFTMNCVGIMNICSLAVVAYVRRSVLSNVQNRSVVRKAVVVHAAASGGSSTTTSNAPSSHVTKETCLTLIGVWCFGLAISLPPLFGWSEYVQEGIGVSCSLRWYHDQPAERAKVFSFALYEFIIGFCLPCGVLGVCYCQLLRIVRQQAKLVSGQVAKVQTRVLLTISAMTIAFLVAWLPYASVAVIVVVTGRPLSPWTMTAPAMLAKTSTVMNPVFYFLTNRNIRTECFVLLRTVKRIFLRREEQCYPQRQSAAPQFHIKPKIDGGTLNATVGRTADGSNSNDTRNGVQTTNSAPQQSRPVPKDENILAGGNNAEKQPLLTSTLHRHFAHLHAANDAAAPTPGKEPPKETDSNVVIASSVQAEKDEIAPPQPSKNLRRSDRKRVGNRLHIMNSLENDLARLFGEKETSSVTSASSVVKKAATVVTRNGNVKLLPKLKTSLSHAVDLSHHHHTMADGRIHSSERRPVLKNSLSDTVCDGAVQMQQGQIVDEENEIVAPTVQLVKKAITTNTGRKWLIVELSDFDSFINDLQKDSSNGQGSDRYVFITNV